jgi:hypothetical protein
VSAFWEVFRESQSREPASSAADAACSRSIWEDCADADFTSSGEEFVDAKKYAWLQGRRYSPVGTFFFNFSKQFRTTLICVPGLLLLFAGLEHQEALPVGRDIVVGKRSGTRLVWSLEEHLLFAEGEGWLRGDLHCHYFAAGTIEQFSSIRIPDWLGALSAKSLAKQFGNALRKVIGDAQVLAEKADLSLDAAI